MRYFIFFNDVREVKVEYLWSGQRINPPTVVTALLYCLSGLVVYAICENIVVTVVYILIGLFVILRWILYLGRIDALNMLSDKAHLGLLINSAKNSVLTNFVDYDDEITLQDSYTNT